jgi:hypothetical protein
MLPRFNQDANMFISEAPSSIGYRSPKMKSPSPTNKSHKALPTSPDMDDQIDNFIVQAQTYLGNDKKDESNIEQAKQILESKMTKQNKL